MKVSVKLRFLDDRGEKFFGEGPARLLHGVQTHGSLRAAAMDMNMAYTKALKLIKQAESALGYPLIARTTGGKDGGGSTLTPEGERLLSSYEAYRDACVEENRRLYRQFFPKTGCVIMASGMGARFGGNKLLADFRGEAMILRAFRATEGLFDSRVVVTRHEAVAQLCREQGIPAQLHSLPGRNDTIRLGLEALGDVDCCLFCPGDQPLLRRQTVETMLNAWRCDREKIIRPVFADAQGSPVLFPAWTFPELQTLPQGKGGSAVIRKHPESIHCVSVADAFELADADTPEALEMLKHLCPDGADRREKL